MLSRTAEGLFWLGRYIERADNVARLLDSGRRLDATADKAGASSNEWAAILIAAGCRPTFPGDIEAASATDAIRHLVIDDTNPSAIQSCFAHARANARAQRGAISADLWSCVNDAWRETRDWADGACAPRYLATTLERTRRFSALFRGALEGTMLRDERYSFLRLGIFIERADATARLVDVKYHVLMPDSHPIGSGMDQLHWNNLLRAAGARSSYRWVYKAPVTARLVIDFLMLNMRSPRSLRFSHEAVGQELERLHIGPAHGRSSLEAANALRSDLGKATIDDIFTFGLHEYLTDMIIRSNKLAIAVGSDFGFGPIVEAALQEQVA